MNELFDKSEFIFNTLRIISNMEDLKKMMNLTSYGQWGMNLSKIFHFHQLSSKRCNWKLKSHFQLSLLFSICTVQQ